MAGHSRSDYSLYDTGGAIPTLDQFKTKGRWLIDENAIDFGRTGLEEKYYANFVNMAKGFKNAGDTARYNATLATHGFGGAAKPAPAAPAPRRRSALTDSAPSATPSPLTKEKEREAITPKAKGLEDTIKTTPRLLRERRRRSYLTS